MIDPYTIVVDDNVFTCAEDGCNAERKYFMPKDPATGKRHKVKSAYCYLHWRQHMRSKIKE